MARIDGLSLKLLIILVAFALVPMVTVGFFSLSEMNRASLDVQNNISSLSTSLNRSALAVAPNDADQMQLAIAKAGQYDEFFTRIASENELIASYASMGDQNDSCSTPGNLDCAIVVQSISFRSEGCNHQIAVRAGKDYAESPEC